MPQNVHAIWQSIHWSLYFLSCPNQESALRNMAHLHGARIKTIVTGIKICRWAKVQISSRDIGVCCQNWDSQGRSFATNNLGEAINLHQCSVAGLNGYYSAFEWYKFVLQLCGNDTTIFFCCWAWVWSRLRSLSLDLVPSQEPQPGFCTGSLLWTGTTLKPQKQLLTERSVFSKPMYFHSYAPKLRINPPLRISKS